MAQGVKKNPRGQRPPNLSPARQRKVDRWICWILWALVVTMSHTCSLHGMAEVLINACQQLFARLEDRWLRSKNKRANCSVHVTSSACTSQYGIVNMFFQHDQDPQPHLNHIIYTRYNCPVVAWYVSNPRRP